MIRIFTFQIKNRWQITFLPFYSIYKVYNLLVYIN